VRATLARASDIPQDPDGPERRLAAFEAIVGIFSRETFLQDWAAAQFNLGFAYDRRIRGVKEPTT
jgi:hypothetical protein